MVIGMMTPAARQVVLLLASAVLLHSTNASEEKDGTGDMSANKMLFDEFQYQSGGFARTYDQRNCPPPYFTGNSFEVIDHWPDGCNVEITVRPDVGQVENGWTILIVFSRPLPKGARILIWNAEETARREDRYITFVNRPHNPNLNNIKMFSLTFVIEGASMNEMSGYSAMVSFYPERIKDAACYLPGNSQPTQRPPATTQRTTTTTTTKRFVPTTTRATTRWTPRTTTRRTPNATPRPPIFRWTPRPTTRRTPKATPRPSIFRWTPRPFTRRTTRPTPRPVRKTTVAPRRTTRKAPFYRPKNQRPRTTARPRTAPRPYRPKTTKRPSRPRTTQRPTRPPRTTTTRRTTTQRPVTLLPEKVEGMTYEYRTSSKMVQQHKGKCKILPRAYDIQNPGYDAGNDLADGSGRKYRCNIALSIPVKNVVRDWTVKLVFAEPIESIQTWEAVASEHSPDGTVWLIRPQEWNSELVEDFEFVMIALMRVEHAPPAITYLCEDGDEPTLLGNGIFERTDGGGHKLTDVEIREMEKKEKQRQEQVRQEQEQREKEQRERQRKEQERRERDERERNEQTFTQAPTNNRPQPTTTARPRLTGPRCRGRDGYPASNPGQTKVSYKKSPPDERLPYDYNEVLAMSILFYEAQRSGKLPSNNRIPWRGDSGMKDGCDVGHDLTGGWYDAGDHVKFGFPMAWSATTLAWGAVEFVDAYKDAKEYNNMLDSLKWVADYFVKAHTSKYEFYGQVGGGGPDHSFWGKAEDMTMKRPAFKIDRNNPGTELAAETAAALAAISIVFKKENPSYSKLLLKHAEELYEFADKYRGEYHKAISDAQGYYRSYSGFNDELVWGALWLAKATGSKTHLADAVRKYEQFGGEATPKMFSWDDKRAGSQVLIAQLTGDSRYRDHIMAYQNFLMSYGKTPQGMVWLDQWGSNRYAANVAMITLAAANLKPPMREKSKLIAFARKQIHLLLGDAGRSYVVGYGRNPPVRPHHRSSSCPPPPLECNWNSAFQNPAGNYFTLYGALVGGPNSKGSYVDKRSDYVANEVATDFNAGFQSAVAGLKHFQIEARNGGGRPTKEELREMEREQEKRQEQLEKEMGRDRPANKWQPEVHTQPPHNPWLRPRPTATVRPRPSGPRCSGSDGYPASRPGQTQVSYKKSPTKERLPYDYNEVISMSILFYEAQRSGKLPSNNRIPWRGDSGLKDGCDVGHDLTGGWYDAGDHVKFGLPMAWSATTLAWGAIEFQDAYRDAHEFNNMLSSLKWVADYFVKAHTGKYEFYGQVGDGGPDHSFWGKAEDMRMPRPAFKIDRSNPGSEVAAETAAALAAISIVFKSEDKGYSRMLLKHAEELYELADKYRGEYHKSIEAAQGYYRSYSGYNDELVWGALWLAKATGSRTYLSDAIRKYGQFGGGSTPKMFSWDDKRAGSQVLIAQLTGESKYRSHVMAYQNFLMNYGRTPQGMVWLDQWGSNRYAANAAFITLAAANLKPSMREKSQLIAFARKQIHLLLGDAGRSYVVGYGRNPPVRPHHRSSSCPPPPRACDWNSAFENPGGNYFTLYGALVGGPNSKGSYADVRSDYVSNEVATDFNAGFQSALAGLKHFQIENRKG